MQTYSRINYNSFDNFIYNLNEEFNPLKLKEINSINYGKGVLKGVRFELVPLNKADILLEIKFKQFRSLKSFSSIIIKNKKSVVFENEEDQKLFEDLVDCFQAALKVKENEHLEDLRNGAK